MSSRYQMSSVVDDIDDFAPTTAFGGFETTNTAGSATESGAAVEENDVWNQGAFGTTEAASTPAAAEATPAAAEADPFGADFAAMDAATETKEPEDAFGLGSSIAQPDAQQQSKLAAWRAEHAAKLQARQEEERKEKARLAQQAQEEIAAFMEKRREQCAKNAARNRADEKQWRADIKSTLETGTDFEKVAKYCELRVKDEGKPPKNDRMRKLLIQLKNERPKA